MIYLSNKMSMQLETKTGDLWRPIEDIYTHTVHEKLVYDVNLYIIVMITDLGPFGSCACWGSAGVPIRHYVSLNIGLVMSFLRVHVACKI